MNFKLKVKNYIRFISRFSIASVSSFFIDIFTYAFLKQYLGINISALISFLTSQIILFLLLKIFLVSRKANNFKSFFILILIGLGSFLIHIVILNIIDLIIYHSYYNFYNQTYFNSKTGAIVTKLICGVFGFLWSSTLINKKLFKTL